MPDTHREVCSVSLPSGGDPMEMLVWAPRSGRIRGALYVIPGLHFQGPNHPRLDRLARIIAHSGILVASPALPDFLAMRVRPGSTADAMAGLKPF